MNAEHYADVAALIDRGETAAVTPEIAQRDDGVGLFYSGQINSLFGHPESGKTLAALAACAQELTRGRAALVVDIDHNGARAIVSKLIAMGVDEAILRSTNRFRYTAPEDVEHYAAVVRDTRAWMPALVIVDSLGELLPLFGASSNSPDDFTRVHTVALKPFAASGAAVVVIDHLAKNVESQAFGSTGTAAKKRAIGGTSLRVTAVKPFKPGLGGTAQLTINKDRHGGLRAASPSEEREPLAARFVLTDSAGDLSWKFYAPDEGEVAAVPGVLERDIDALTALDPPPTSQRDVKQRMGWGSTRSLDTLTEWRRRGAPRSPLPMSGAREHAAPDAPGALPEHENPDLQGFSGIARGAEQETMLPAPHTGGQEHGSTPGALTCRACGEPLSPVLADVGVHAGCEVVA